MAEHLEGGDDDQRIAHLRRLEGGVDGDGKAARRGHRAAVGGDQAPAVERAAGGAVGGAQRLQGRGEREQRDVGEDEEVDVEGARLSG